MDVFLTSRLFGCFNYIVGFIIALLIYRMGYMYILGDYFNVILLRYVGKTKFYFLLSI